MVIHSIDTTLIHSSNSGWKNREWKVSAELVRNGNSMSSDVIGTTTVNITAGVTSFDDLAVSGPGAGYQIKLRVYTVPSSK